MQHGFIPAVRFGGRIEVRLTKKYTSVTSYGECICLFINGSQCFGVRHVNGGICLHLNALAAHSAPLLHTQLFPCTFPDDGMLYYFFLVC